MNSSNQDAVQGVLFPEYATETVRKKAKRTSGLTLLKEEKRELEERVKELDEENAKLKVKADAFDELISSSSLFTTTVIAKSFGWSAVKLNQYLKDKKVQYQQGDV